jgi:hypothetical protein
MSANQTMYEENVYFPDTFKGCGFDCVYCVPSFQRQAKRQKQRCQLCYEYKPHFHPERLYKSGKLEFIKTKTTGEQFIFFPKGGDPCFATDHIFKQMLAFISYNSQTTFLMQTKSPEFMLVHERFFCFPENLILGITIESNQDRYQTPSKYEYYGEISMAPIPLTRASIFSRIAHKRKFVTIEPILQFDAKKLIYLLHLIGPQAVYVGYDTKGCKLPEPKLADAMGLIADLRGEGFTVRTKTIRKAWWE